LAERLRQLCRWMVAMKKKFPAAADLDEARLRQQALGTKLRQMFDAVVNEPVPDDFIEILRRADSEEPGKER
jgi:hypothetical protein